MRSLIYLGLIIPISASETGGEDYIFTTVPAIPLIAYGAANHEIARLGPGGSITGPFVIYDNEGKEIFKLEAGVTYPTPR